MSQRLDQQRLKHLVLTAASAVVMLAGAVTLSVMDVRQAWTPDVSGPVLTDWSANVQAAREIEIVNAQERFVIKRSPSGWTMPSRDGFAVRPERLAALDNLLMSLEYEGARTADPGKHDRLSLAEEGQENGANRVILRDADGQVPHQPIRSRYRDQQDRVNHTGQIVKHPPKCRLTLNRRCAADIVMNEASSCHTAYPASDHGEVRDRQSENSGLKQGP